MKKLSFLLVAGAMISFVACNSAKTEGGAENADSTKNAMTNEAAAMVDTTKKADTTAAATPAKAEEKKEETKK